MFNKLWLGRRTLLKTIGLSIPAFMASPSKGFTALLFDNPIVNENKKPGTTDWRIIDDPADNREIEGYASWTSIDRGDSIQIFVNTAEPSFKLEVFRLGWYGGAGGRRVFGPITLRGTQQVIPIPDPVTGCVECDWNNPFTLRTGFSWTTGVYLVKLTAGVSNKQSYVPFTLRDDNSRANLVFQNSVTTYQAYNGWGGKSLYSFNSTDDIAAVKVSFNRPYAGGNGAGQLFSWELSLLRFLEREGYDVAYCTNITTHNDPSMLRRHKAFLSVGHDEYWSLEMRRNITAARDHGIHLGFFGANCCYWQIRIEPSPLTGQPRRTIVCYRARQKDPLFGVNNARVTELWRSDLLNQAEEQLVGVQYDFFPVNTDMVVSNAQHFIFEGTGLNNGAHLPGLVGYEADRTFGGGPANIIRLCSSPISSPPTIIAPINPSERARPRPSERLERKTSEQLGIGTRGQLQTLSQQEHTTTATVGNSEMTIYTASSGALVFATGSMQFNWGLDDAVDSTRVPLVNPAAQIMVHNLLRRFV